jgi:hypothetical protein
MPSQSLSSTAQKWLNDGFDGIGNAGPVGGQKVRYYDGRSMHHEMHGYEIARARFSRDYGGALQGGERSGFVGLVGERLQEGTTSLVCEAFDLATGESVLVVQPFRKKLLGRKRIGDVKVLGAAEPLPDMSPSPALESLIKELKSALEGGLTEAKDRLAEARVEIRSSFDARRNDYTAWDCFLTAHRDMKRLELWKIEIWSANSASLTPEDFKNWMEERLNTATGL